MPTRPRNLRLFYASKAARAFGKRELDDILKKCIADNERDQLHGLLCYKNQIFAQILEGEETAVLRAYLGIVADDRHTEVTLISISTVDELLFSNWKMGYLDNAAILDMPWEKIMSFRAHTEGQMENTLRRLLQLLERTSPNAATHSTPATILQFPA